MSSADHVLALDLGGTRLKVGRVDVGRGRVHDVRTADTAGRSGAAALAVVAEVGRAAAAGAGGVGLAVPGIVEDQRITALPGKFDGIVGLDLGAWLRDTFGVPAHVTNDAIAYGAGEVRHGAGAGAHRAVVVTIGTGVGVTVYEDGLPTGTGPYGAGILGGQIPISDPTGPLDTNGRAGTIEARCRAATITHRAAEAGCDATDVPAVLAAARDGDERALVVVDETRRWLATALVALAHAHGPDVVVLGGGAMPADSPVLSGLEDAVNAQLWPGYEVRVRPAALGDHASLLGLAHLTVRGRS
ncbi:MAG: ROK family protein [Actinomycetes bacterium]